MLMEKGKVQKLEEKVKNTHWTKKPVLARNAKKMPIRYNLAEMLRCWCEIPIQISPRLIFRIF